MALENNNEKFFEELAEKMDHGDSSVPQPEIELAKASTAPAKAKNTRATTVEETNPFDEELEGQLTVDVYQTPTDIVIESAVAGVNPEDIDVNVTRDSITIRGKRHREKKIKDEDYFYQECYWGKFSRSVILPQEIDPEGVKAIFKNGILSVHLPKLNKDKTKKVQVKPE